MTVWGWLGVVAWVAAALSCARSLWKIRQTSRRVSRMLTQMEELDPILDDKIAEMARFAELLGLPPPPDPRPTPAE